MFYLVLYYGGRYFKVIIYFIIKCARKNQKKWGRGREATIIWMVNGKSTGVFTMLLQCVGPNVGPNACPYLMSRTSMVNFNSSLEALNVF